MCIIDLLGGERLCRNHLNVRKGFACFQQDIVVTVVRSLLNSLSEETMFLVNIFLESQLASQTVSHFTCHSNDV